MSIKSYLNQPLMPRGLRNNNPGNLVRTSIAWEGKVPHSQNTDPKFEQYFFLAWGIRALMRDIINDFNKGKRTVSQIISEFAPSFENNTASYIQSVANMVGIGPHETIHVLDAQKVIGLSKAIVYIENGTTATQYVTNADYELGYQLRDALFIEKKK